MPEATNLESAGEYVRRIRIGLGISLREMARRLQISPTYLSHIELNIVKRPTSKKLAVLARELGLDEKDLFRRFGRSDDEAIKGISTRNDVRRLVELVLAMGHEDVQELVDEIENRNVTTEPGGRLLD